MEIKVCKCGGTPEVVKIFEKGRPDCFVRCPECGSETKCYTSRQNAVKAWNDGRLYIGETAEMVERLRKRAMVGRMEVRDKLLVLKAADMLEDLRQDVDEWIACFDMLNDRENRHKYLDYWREKNGEDELCYPDGDEVYKDFFEMKARVEESEKENERLKHILNCYALQYGTVMEQDVVEVVYGEWEFDPDGNDWGIGAWVCSKCRAKNDNLGIDTNINPYLFAGSKWCPQCGAKMGERKDQNG